MKLLITGGAGFIGSNLVKRCVTSGFEVDVVDNLSNGHVEFIQDALPHRNDGNLVVDNFDCPTILNRIQSKKYDVVVHLAAIPRVSYSVEHPIETHETNVTATLRLMDTCRGNIKRFVFASSSSVYGNTEILPTRVDTVKNPKSPYALQKSIIEDYLRLYHELYNLDSVSLRFFNIFGPNQLGNSPYATAVSSWLNSVMCGESMRSDGDGSQSRDMCYVDNVVDACIKSAESMNQLKAATLNVACGDRVTNTQILEYLLKKFPASQFHSAPWRPGDVMHTQADISMSTHVLGYQPTVMFWEGLDRTIQWYQDNWEKIKELSNKVNL